MPSMISPSPVERVSHIPRRYAISLTLICGRADSARTNTLPPWENIVATAELYLLYCDCQPLPLFDRGSFLGSLESRDPEVLLSILALASRFSTEENVRSNISEVVKGYVEAARALVIQRLPDGPIELSTLQSLCLLSLVDFTGKSNSTVDYRVLMSTRWQYTTLEHQQYSGDGPCPLLWSDS